MMRRRPIVEALEPRLLYSADSAALAAAVLGPPATEQRVIDGDAEFAPQTEQAVQNASREVVFIDGRTPDYELLVQDIAAQSGRQVDVVMLDTTRDGLEQITEALAGRENVAALHIIAHGDEGVVQLGNALVTADSLQNNQYRIEAWSKALTADADILLYGCDVAASVQGQLFVDALARLTGADVSASDDATGHTALGGDWKLEYATGAIEAQVALSQSGQDAWSHLLGTIVLVANEPPFGDMPDFDPAYEIQGGNSIVQSFTYTSGAGTYTVGQIDLVLYKNANANGNNVNVQLRDATTTLASGSVSRAGLGLSEGWASVSLKVPATLTDGVTYFIRIQGSGSGDIFVGVDDTGTYGGGNANIGGTDEPLKDLAFRVISTDAPVVDLNGPGTTPATIGQDNAAAFTEQTPVLIAPNGELTDPDSANLASLTVTLTARPNGDAVESLSLTASAATTASGAGLTVTYTSATGVLSITGSASIATYQTILQGIQYNNTSDAPITTDRSVTVVASDGSTPSVARTSFITVTAVNDAPVLSGASNLATINEDPVVNGGTLVSALIAGQVTDGDASALSGIAVTAVDNTNGTWEYSTNGGGVWNAFGNPGGGSSRLLAADANTYVRFVPTTNFNGTVSSGITFRAWDQTSGSAGGTANTNTNGGATAFSGATASSSITVTAVNDAPVLAGAGGTLATTEGDAATLIDATLALSDVDDVNIESATVTISTGLVSTEDLLGFTSAFGITGSYTAATGVLALSGSATLAQYESVLESVTYQNTNTGNPGTGARTITWVVNDGTDNSAGATSTVTVAAVNDAPVADLNAGGAGQDVTVAFTEQTPVLVAPVGTLADVDSANLTSLTLTLTARPDGNAVESLSLDAAAAAAASGAGLTVSYTAATGVLSITGSASVATYQTILQGVQYANTSDTPTTSNRSVTVVANDGALPSAAATSTATVAAVNDAPLNTVPGAQTTNEDTVLVFSAGNGNAISIGDVDAGTSPVQVVLTGANGAITLAGIAGLTFAVGDGVADAAMTFSGTLGAVNAALNGLSFMPGANFSGAASLSISADDQGNTGAGGALSDADAVTITVLPNVAPTVTASGGTIVFTEGNNVAPTPVVLDSAVTVSDPDSTTLAGATISIGAGWQAAEDVLGFANNPATMGNIAGGYNAATGVLSLSSAGATATLAQWQAALRAVVYTDTSDTPSTAARTVSFVVSGQGGSSAGSTQQVAVTAVNDAPMVAMSGAAATFTGGGSAVLVDAALAVGDVDNATLAGATVSISGGFQAGQDLLGFGGNPATMGNIAGSYNAASGVLTLSSAGATATLAQWQAALRSVVYDNASATPIIGARAVGFDVSDGNSYGPVASGSVTVNPAPVVPPTLPPVVPPPVIPPVVLLPPPVTPPPTTAPQQSPTVVPGRPAGAAAEESGEGPTLLASVETSAGTASVGQHSTPAAPGLSPVRLASFTVALGVPSAESEGELTLAAVRQVEARQLDVFASEGQLRRLTETEGLGSDLARLRDGVREQEEIQTRGVVTLAAGSLSMTLAYLLWLVRGGALAASMLSALPAWRLIDPLPVLARVDDEDDDEGAEEDDQAVAPFSWEPEGGRIA